MDDVIDSESASEESPSPAGSAANQATSSDRATPHAASQTCSTDALGVIFSFLPLEDVASSAVACRRWLEAIETAAATSGRHQITITSVRALRDIAESPLRRLVGEIDISSLTLVSGDRIESLWAAFPHLTALTCTIDARQLVDWTALQFPRTLRSLDVAIVGVLGWSHLDVLLSLVARCPLTRLCVSVSPHFPGLGPRTPPVDAIERLLALRDTITDLEFRWRRMPGEPYWQSSHIAVFRSLPHLTRLHAGLGRWTDEELDLLTADPVPIHLTSLDRNLYGLKASTLSLLARLPLFGSLHAETVSIADSVLLAHLPPHSVETMSIDGMGIKQRHSLELARELARYTHITDLSLEDMHLSPAEVAAVVREFLPSLVRLRSLITDALPGDIAWLASAPNLADTLECIRITEKSVSSLLHLRSLRRLRSATIFVVLGRGGQPSVELTEADSETVFLPSLTSLRLTLYRVDDDLAVDIGRLFGRLPSLRTLQVQSYGPQWRLLPLPTHLTEVTDLTLDTEGTLASADLARVVSVMPHLRQLHLGGDLDDLSFLSSSSSARLAHSLERLTLTFTTHMAPREFAHLRSLGSLQYLKLILDGVRPLSAADESECGDSSLSASSSCGSDVMCPSGSSQSVLASLRELHFRHRSESVDVPESALRRRGVLFQLGPLPNLRTATIKTTSSAVHQQGILDALAHSTRLTQLTLTLYGLMATDAVLTSLLRPMTRLRSLVVKSDAFDGLSFLSAPHIAATLEELTIRILDQTFEVDPPSMPTSSLHHLRALHQLRTLTLALAVDRDEDDSRSTIQQIDEYMIDHHHFPRHIWPALHHSDVNFSFESE